MAEASDPPSPRPAAAWRFGALVLLAALVAANWAAFRAFGSDFFAFWLKSGPIIGLATSALGWAWGGLDRHRGLVSADPLTYAGAALQGAGLPLLAFGGALRRDLVPGGRRNLWDMTVALPLSALVGLAVLGWLVLIAPMQYFAFLIFAAPARIALASRYRLHARLVNGRLEIAELCKLDPAAGTEPKPDAGAWNASMTDRPLALSAALMGAGLLALDRIIAF